VVDRGIAAGDIIRAARNAERNLIDTISVFDVYEGKGVPEGKKSIAIAVRIAPRDKTLTDGEIDAIAEKIVAGVAKATGASLRS
jgi:phenylalanyl-tRNA synthetase beta chain